MRGKSLTYRQAFFSQPVYDLDHSKAGRRPVEVSVHWRQVTDMPRIRVAEP